MSEAKKELLCELNQINEGFKENLVVKSPRSRDELKVIFETYKSELMAFKELVLRKGNIAELKIGIKNLVERTASNGLKFKQILSDAVSKCPLYELHEILDYVTNVEKRLNEYVERCNNRTLNNIDDLRACFEEFKQDEIVFRQEIEKKLKLIIIGDYGGEKVLWHELRGHRLTVGSTRSGKTVYSTVDNQWKYRAIASACNYGSKVPQRMVIVDADGLALKTAKHYGVRDSSIFQIGYRSKEGFGWKVGKDVRSSEDIQLFISSLLGDEHPLKKSGGSDSQHFEKLGIDILSARCSYLIKTKGTDWDLLDVIEPLCIDPFKMFKEITDFNLPGYESLKHLVIYGEDGRHGGDTFSTLRNFVYQFKELAGMWRFHILNGRSFSINEFCNKSGVLILPRWGYTGTNLLDACNTMFIRFVTRILKTKSVQQEDIKIPETYIDIDELTQIKKNDEFFELLTEGLKFGIVLHTRFQNISRFEEVYGEKGVETLVSNCNYIITFNSTGIQTIETFCNAFGKAYIPRIVSFQQSISDNWNNSHGETIQQAIVNGSSKAFGNSVTNAITRTQGNSSTKSQAKGVNEALTKSKTLAIGNSRVDTKQYSYALAKGEANSIAEGVVNTFAETVTEQINSSIAKGENSSKSLNIGGSYAVNENRSETFSRGESETDTTGFVESLNLGITDSETHGDSKSSTNIGGDTWIDEDGNSCVKEGSSSTTNTDSSSYTSGTNLNLGFQNSTSKAKTRNSSESETRGGGKTVTTNINRTATEGNSFVKTDGGSISHADMNSHADSVTRTKTTNSTETNTESDSVAVGSNTNRSEGEAQMTGRSSTETTSDTESNSQADYEGNTQTLTCTTNESVTDTKGNVYTVNIGGAVTVTVTIENEYRTIIQPHDISTLRMAGKQSGVLEGIFMRKNAVTGRLEFEKRTLSFSEYIEHELPPEDDGKKQNCFLIKSEEAEAIWEEVRKPLVEEYGE